MSHSLTVETLTLDRAFLMTAVAVIEETLHDLKVRDEHTADQNKSDCLVMIKEYLEAQRTSNNVLALAAFLSYEELCALYRVLKLQDDYQAILREAVHIALAAFSTLDVDKKLTDFKDFFEDFEVLSADERLVGSYQVHG